VISTLGALTKRGLAAKPYYCFKQKHHCKYSHCVYLGEGLCRKERQNRIVTAYLAASVIKSFGLNLLL